MELYLSRWDKLDKKYFSEACKFLERDYPAFDLNWYDGSERYDISILDTSDIHIIVSDMNLKQGANIGKGVYEEFLYVEDKPTYILYKRQIDNRWQFYDVRDIKTLLHFTHWAYYARLELGDNLTPDVDRLYEHLVSSSLSEVEDQPVSQHDPVFNYNDVDLRLLLA